MTDDEYDSWVYAISRSYAAEQVAAGNWGEQSAVERALAENAELLPHGRATEGMLLLTATDGEDRAIGVLWIALVHPRGTPDCAYIYDIEVHERYRGLGHGRRLLAAAERAVLARGVHSMMLNVFAENGRATNLYGSSGYTVVTQQMRKQLG